MKSPIYILIVTFWATALNGQVDFRNTTEGVMGEVELFSTIGIGFDDINGDRMDDLILLDEGRRLRTMMQGKPEQSFDYMEHETVSGNGDWAIISGDLDNDGIPEIICSGNEDGSQFLKYDGERFETSYKVGQVEDVFSQNTNLVDLNNDGYLDFFVCNDIGESLTFINDGNGNMQKVKLIDFKTSPTDDMSGNYSSIFTDIDNDNDLDLYIGKCRAGVTDPTDPRRINTLYINNGDGTYTESGTAFGLAIGAQSWSVDSGDVDNDGDLDLIITNHDAPHDLMINQGDGTFKRRTMIPGGYSSPAIQGLFCDFDNNGWLDIFITDLQGTYILFNEEMSFSRREVVDRPLNAFSGAIGDLNSDGFPDLYLSFAVSYQVNTGTPDEVYLNETNTNNFLDIHLEGTVSNRDAIGAKVIIYHDGTSQMREIVAGKSYGIMNSTVAHFGLGQRSSVDSIKVLWPSGIVTKIPAWGDVNTSIYVQEDGCITSLYKMPDLQLCDGEPVEASLPEEYSGFQWSTGDTTFNTLISEPGFYNATFSIQGCEFRTEFFEVKEEDLISTSADVIMSGDVAACSGEVVELTSIPGTAYFWSSGENTESIDVIDNGEHSVFVTTSCGGYQSLMVSVFFHENEVIEIETDSFLYGQQAYFEGNSEDLNWYLNKNDIDPIYTGMNFETPELFEDRTYFVGKAEEGYGFDVELMSNIPLNSVGDSIYTENEFLEFEVFDKILLNSVKVRTQVPGIRRFLILEGEDVLGSYDIELDAGVNVVNFDMSFGPGVYRLGTDEDVNMSNLGSANPQLSYSDLYSENSKKIHAYISIGESELYPGITPYFFAWNIDYGHYHCEPRFPARAVLKEIVSTKEVLPFSNIYPNPTSGWVTIETDLTVPFYYDIRRMDGSIVVSKQMSSQAVARVRMPKTSGVYFLTLYGDKVADVKKIIVY